MSLNEKVVSLHGDPIPDPGLGDLPNIEVIERIQLLLERAKRGEITGIAYATAGANALYTTGFLWKKRDATTIGCGVGILQLRVMQDLDED